VVVVSFVIIVCIVVSGDVVVVIVGFTVVFADSKTLDVSEDVDVDIVV